MRNIYKRGAVNNYFSIKKKLRIQFLSLNEEIVRENFSNIIKHR